MLEFGDDHAAFLVVLAYAYVADDLQRLLFGKNSHPGIALAFGAVRIYVIAVYAFQGLFYLLGLGLGFLQQNTVGIKQLKRFGKAFALHRANAVDIPGDYFHVGFHLMG